VAGLFRRYVLAQASGAVPAQGVAPVVGRVRPRTWGPVSVVPNHIVAHLYASGNRTCPATEPTESGLAEPVAAEGHWSQRGQRCSGSWFIDTGWYATSRCHGKLLSGVQGQPDTGAAVFDAQIRIRPYGPRHGTLRGRRQSDSDGPGMHHLTSSPADVPSCSPPEACSSPAWSTTLEAALHAQTPLIKTSRPAAPQGHQRPARAFEHWVGTLSWPGRIRP
jgi:hypothetical protein